MRLLKTSIAAVAATVAIAGCGSDDSGSTPSGAAAQSNSGTTVSVKTLDGVDKVLVDSSGAALYTPDQEAGGKILCTGDCTSEWMPLTVSSGKPDGASKLATIKRPDGTRQVTLMGKPLYTFVEDGAGKVTGDGFEDDFGGQHFTWHVMTTSGPGAPQSSSSDDSGGTSTGGGYNY